MLTFTVAPELRVDQWFNEKPSFRLSSLRGRVVVVFAFQMLCPGCVQHSIPQAKQVHAAFDPSEVVVLGLHTVFEHHDVMTPHALAAFIHENRITFPVGVDSPQPGSSIPRTMAEYAMRGTPTLLLIDALGRLRMQHLGQLSDLTLGAQLAKLLQELPAERASAPFVADSPRAT
ncbi:MAG: hypothetical protein RLZZ450_6933 [Pseudomonadota bacterium]|jgi:peroxiredoxin